jgi:diguanylate cyclase (GGDEF)-like protein/PAS domain S-box-containing protein
VSQTSIADPTAAALPARPGGTLARRMLCAAGLGAVLWLAQAVLALLDPVLGVAKADWGGVSAMRPDLLLAAFVLTVLLAGLCALRRDAAVRPLPAAWAGAGLAILHLLLLIGLPQGAGVRAGGLTALGGAGLVWALEAVAVSAATLAALAWSSVLLADRWGRICAAIGGLAGLVMLHLSDLAALQGAALEGLGAAAAVWCAGIGVLVGARLGDLALVANPRSVALRERFRIIAEALPIPIVLTGPDNRRVLFANQRSQAQFASAQNAVPASTDAYYVTPDDQHKLLERLRRTGSVENYEIEMRRGDGSTFWALVSASSISFSGEPAILASYHDITDRKAAEEALLASEVRYALISRAANDGIWDWDIPSGAVYFSTRWKEIVGILPGQRLSALEDWLSRVHTDDVGRVRRDIEAHVAGTTPQLDCEYRILHGDGRYCWMQCRAIALRNNLGEPIRMAGSQSDITLRKTYEINLLNAAYEDRLTGINNRTFFSQLVESRNTTQAIEGTAILVLNIDQFRRLNDSLGTAAGDTLLIAMARRLAARIKPTDALSRVGNDEFAIWLQHAVGHDAALAVAETLLADLSQPYALGEVEMSVAVSVGIAAPTLGDAENGAELMRNARLALDRAKLVGGARAELFDDALLRETNLKRRLSKDLTAAERLGQIFFEFQPVVALEAGGINKIVGFEMLMRWRHPELGLIPPGRFIPIAEEAGLIGQLGLFAIECAAQQIAAWTEAGLVPAEFSIAVNLSNRQISDRAGTLRLHALLDRLAIPAGRLKLEITESVLMSDPEVMATTLHEFRQRGIELSLDDFGTGYSSLSYLHRFPLDVLKIDRSFVSRMLRAPEALRLVRSIIELSHDLGLKVVAEGVEALEESDLLRELGCDNAQGYYYSRPVSSEQARALLERRIIAAAQADPVAVG